MKLEDSIREMIRRKKSVALELFIRSRDRHFKISDQAFKWLKENGYVFKDDVRANVLEFFRNKVMLVENSLQLKTT